MSKVIVYHGTTIDRAKRILKDRVLRTTDAAVCRYEDTAKGFVYVTKRLCDALDFSTKPEVDKDTLVFAVFKICIDEQELIPDEDEFKWQSTLSDDGAKECYKIQRDLIVGKDVIAVFGKRMPTYNVLGDYMQAIQYGEREIKESEWKELCHD